MLHIMGRHRIQALMMINYCAMQVNGPQAAHTLTESACFPPVWYHALAEHPVTIDLGGSRSCCTPSVAPLHPEQAVA